MLLNSPSSTSVCLTSQSTEKVMVETIEMIVYQATILLVGGPAKGLMSKLVNELDAAGGGVRATATECANFQH